MKAIVHEPIKRSVLYQEVNQGNNWEKNYNLREIKNVDELADFLYPYLRSGEQVEFTMNDQPVIVTFKGIDDKATFYSDSSRLDEIKEHALALFEALKRKEHETTGNQG